VRSIVRTLQPKAEIIECNYGDVSFDKILNTNMFDFDKVATSAAWIQEVERHHEEDEDDNDDEEHEHEHEHEDHHHHDHDEDDHDEHEHHHHHHHHHHHDEGEAEEYGIGTFVYYRRRPFNLGLFDEFVARKWPKGVIRAKGICYFKDEMDMCYLFEQAGKQVSIRQAGQWFATMPKEELAQMMERDAALRADWDEQYGDRMQKIVFIGQHLDKELITRELDSCLV
jgi:G3E family GTPase